MNLFYELDLLALAGLVWLSYQEPALARKLLYIMQGILVVTYMLFAIYYMAKSNAYYEATSESYVVDLKTKSLSLNADSIYNAEKNAVKRDSIIAEYREIRDRNDEITDAKIATQDSVRAKIGVLIDSNQETYDTVVLYSGITFVEVIVLFILCLIFEEHHKSKSVPNKPNND